MDETGIETYPVGFLLDIRRLYAYMIHPTRYGRKDAIKAFWRTFKWGWKRKNYWNGFLAEWHYPPQDNFIHPNCGKGWTRARALKRLGRNIVAYHLTVEEARRQSK